MRGSADAYDPVRGGERSLAVLLVQRDASGLDAVADGLNDEGAWCETTDDLMGLPDRAREARVDVVVVDLDPEVPAVATAIRRLREDHRTSGVPVMVVVDGADARVVADLEALDVDDYITRPFALPDLHARAQFAARRRGRRAAVDALTGLPGRSALVATLTERLVAQEPFALLQVDLDGLGAFNARHGMDRGDDAIRSLAQHLGDAAGSVPGPGVVLSHFGGDDFVVACRPEEARLLAMNVVSRFEGTVAELYPEAGPPGGYVVLSDREGRPQVRPDLAVSIGVTTWDGRREATIPGLLDVVAELCAHAGRGVGSRVSVDRRTEDQGPWARREDAPPG